MSVKEALHQEIEKLPDIYAAEVFNFIKFLETKSEQNELTKQMESISEVSFAKIWDNLEDAEYDSL